jgi:integrase
MARRKNKYGLHQPDKARGIWHCDFFVAGTRIQRSTFTADRASAEEWCSETSSRIWRERKLGEAPKLKWEEAAALWARNKLAKGKRDLATDLDRLRILEPLLIGRDTSTMTVKDVADVLDQLQIDRGLSNGTRNRYQSQILGVLNHCRKNGYNTPHLIVEKYDEDEGRIRWLSKAEAFRLLVELPLHLRRMVEFSLATGLRQSNVTSLLWEKVSIERRVAWVDATDAKGKRIIQVPLSDDAIAILLDAKECGKHGHKRLAFSYFGAAVEQPANSAWKKALVRAEIPAAVMARFGDDSFRWHDLRHTWASWHVMGLMDAQGRPTPLEVLQKLGGWRSLQMVQKYAHLSPDYTASFVGNAGLRQQPQVRAA